MSTYFILCFGFVLAISARWAISYFGMSAFEQIIFHIKVPLEGTNTRFIYDWFIKCFLKGFCFGTCLFVLFQWMHFDLNAWYFFILCCIYGLIKIEFFQYIKHQFQTSKLYENEYVEYIPEHVIKPDKPRNLIHIYLESMETTYATKENGGNSSDDLLPFLTTLTKKNVNFSNTNSIGGFKVMVGTGWTTGGMVASEAGIPLTFPIWHKFCKDSVPFCPGATGLSDILTRDGYNQVLMIGSDAKFGGRYSYFSQHGKVDIQDYTRLKEEGKIPEDYRVFWGFEDDKLFDLAKDKILELYKENQPFNFTMLTVDTHHPYGYQGDTCENVFKVPLSNSIHHTDELLKDFITWIQKQDFYKDTTIVIQGDHVSMAAEYINANYDTNYDRRVWNVFVNSAKKPVKASNRQFTTMDMYPTILSSLGYAIKKNRLSLGTDLFSNDKTILEKYGFKHFNEELAKKNKFYYKNILGL